MGKVIIHATMSLDGFIAGPHDEMDWVFRYGSDKMVDEIMGKIGAVVLGKRTFDISLKKNQLPYGDLVKVPQFVLTSEAQESQTIGGLTFNFITDGVESAINQAKAVAGDKNIMLLGANINQQCLKVGLADEIVIHLAPILLGGGIRLFDHLDSERIELERIKAVATGDITSLRFRVIK